MNWLDAIILIICIILISGTLCYVLSRVQNKKDGFPDSRDKK